MAELDVEIEQDDSEDESPENNPSFKASKNLPKVNTYKKAQTYMDKNVRHI